MTNLFKCCNNSHLARFNDVVLYASRFLKRYEYFRLFVINNNKRSSNYKLNIFYNSNSIELYEIETGYVIYYYD